MAIYPGNENFSYKMTEPGSILPGANKNVVRIIVHQTWTPQSRRDQAPINKSTWTKNTREGRKTHPEYGVSAHFTVEADGRVFQHVDTKDGAKGTSAYAYNAVHIEFASKDEPLTNDQLHYGADLMAWIASEHPNVLLVPVGTSNDDPGDKAQEGVTCHSFVEKVAKVKHPKTTCPGPKIIDQLSALSMLAMMRAALL
jgi:hypothetical protein